jgi:hypothetical protein
VPTFYNIFRHAYIKLKFLLEKAAPAFIGVFVLSFSKEIKVKVK